VILLARDLTTGQFGYLVSAGLTKLRGAAGGQFRVKITAGGAEGAIAE
jgi:hypothetical protein